jgi:hypothetical protein
MKDDIKKFEEIKKEAEELYKLIDFVECPFLKRKIRFNSKGLDHIKFKAWNKTRLMSDQYLRLKFLKVAPEILKKAATLQEFVEKNSFERVKINSRWSKKLVPVKYYGFVAILNYKLKVKVVVKEVCGREPYFWSIMPFWKTRRDELNDKIKKVLHEGDLEND